MAAAGSLLLLTAYKLHKISGHSPDLMRRFSGISATTRMTIHFDSACKPTVAE
jgi:hypothetical protein